MRFNLLVAAVSTAQCAFALLPKRHQVTPPLLLDQDGEVGTLDAPGKASRAPTIHRGIFQQLIDHSNPDLGTFDQHYWWNDEWYQGPGSPIVLYTPGELPASPITVYVTNATLIGWLARSNGGASVMLEHRYWGESSPYEDLTVENLQHLTLNNSIQDLIYFADNVRFPFDCHGSSTPDKAPWILFGASYSAALTAWTHHLAPGTFWSYVATSAVVQAIEHFWEFFVPIEEAMARNCSADVARAIDYIDDILLGGSEEGKQDLKERFGLGGVVHDDDFGSALQTPLWYWQVTDFYRGYTEYFQFCDYVENQWPGSNQTAPGPEGVGTEKAIEGWAKWTREQMLPGYCKNTYGYWEDESTVECFDSHNASSIMFSDITPSNSYNRQWYWFTCNEPFMWFQEHAPPGRRNIISRTVTSAYWEAQCSTIFGNGTYGAAKGLTADDFNAYTGGWDRTNTTRLIWANGEFDPWRTASVSSQFRPGGPLESTEEAPVFLIPDGVHCSDMFYVNTISNEGLKKIFHEEVAIVKRWVGEFYEEKGLTRPSRRK